MNRAIKIIILSTFFMLNFTIIFAQEFEKPKTTFSFATPYLPHSINTSGKEGFSFVYNFPGFFSYLGQAKLYYTNGSGDSFFGGIGLMYLIGGLNKQLLNFNQSSLYLNINIGTMFAFGTLGSLGLSYLKQLSHSTKLEITTDLYYDHGQAIYGPPDIPYSRGVVVGLNYGRKITEKFEMYIGLGISYVQFRYVRPAEGSEYPYSIYIYRSSEDNFKSENLGWDSNIVIPIGVTLSYQLN